MVADSGSHHYLRFGENAAVESTTSFWKRQCRQVIPGANGLPVVPYVPIAETALTVTRLPCGDTDVQSAFPGSGSSVIINARFRTI
jgi:hypothetical protein